MLLNFRLRVIAAISLAAFFLNTIVGTIAWAGTNSSLETNFFAKNLKGFNIPMRYGEIKNIRKGTNGKLIVHIQDAHCNYACQHSIDGIIKHIKDTYDINLVSLEGGRGKYDLSIFTNIGDNRIRQSVSDYFVKEGRVNGAEYYAINNPGKVELFGIEDDSLYFENLNAYKASLTSKQESDKCLSALDNAIMNLKEKIYTDDLKSIDQSIRSYKDGKIDFKTYIVSITTWAKKLNIDMSKYTVLDELKNILESEKSIDFKEADIERSNLLDILSAKLSKSDLEEVVIKTVQFKAGDITSEEFYSFLFRKARFSNADIGTLPNLVRYSEYIKKYESLDKTFLFQELSRLEKDIMAIASDTDDQRKLHAQSENFSILKGMFDVAITKEEFDHYQARKKEFEVRSFIEFINQKGSIYGAKTKISDDVKKLDEYRANMEKFYTYSLKRDEAFIRNIEKKMTDNKTNATMLMTGGFHAGNLEKLFTDKGYSYIEIMPKFESVGECQYFKLLSGGKSSIEKVVGMAVSGIAVQSMMSELRKLGIVDTDRDWDLYSFSVKVVAALNNPENNDGYTVLLRTIGGESMGCYKITFNAPANKNGEYGEPICVIDGKTVYAVRQQYDGLIEINNDAFAVAYFDRPGDFYAGHQVVVDLFLKMAYDKEYEGLEVHTLNELKGWSSVRAVMSEKGITPETLSRLERLSEQGFVHVITGKNGSTVSENMGSSSPRYGVNISYMCERKKKNGSPLNVDEFIRGIFHELNALGNPQLSHEENYFEISERILSENLRKIDALIEQGRIGKDAVREPGSDPANIYSITDSTRTALTSVSGLMDMRVVEARLAEARLPNELTVEQVRNLDFNGKKFARIVGFTTFSGNVKGVENSNRVENVLKNYLRGLIAKYGRENVLVVCGATDFGGVHNVYNVASSLGIPTMGLVARVGLESCKTDMRQCDYYYIEDKNIPYEGAKPGDWGAESPMFIQTIDELVMFGGGAQAADEMKSVAKQGKPVTVITDIRTLMGTIGQAEMSYLVATGHRADVEKIVIDSQSRLNQPDSATAIPNNILSALEKQLKEAKKALNFSLDQETLSNITTLDAMRSDAVSITSENNILIFDAVKREAVSSKEGLDGWVKEEARICEKSVRGCAPDAIMGNEPALICIELTDSEYVNRNQVDAVKSAANTYLEVAGLGTGRMIYYFNKNDSISMSKLNDKMSSFRDKDRIIVFAHTRLEYGQPVAIKELESKCYKVVYMNGQRAETTVTPLAGCVGAGISLLNHAYMEKKQAADKSVNLKELRDSAERVLESIAIMSGGTVNRDEIESTLNILEAKNFQLSDVVLLAKLCPVDIQQLVNFHKREAEVMRAL